MGKQSPYCEVRFKKEHRKTAPAELSGQQKHTAKARPSVVPFALSAIIRGIQKRRCPCIDTHQLPLGLPVRLAHGHQKIYSLSDLL